MKKHSYSAGAVKLAFWFTEFRRTIRLLSEGKTYADIKLMVETENLYETTTPARAKQIYNTITARIKELDSSVYHLFLRSDLPSQKLIALTSVMAQDTLFFDFMYEVVREKFILGIDELTDTDVSIFFKHKRVQDERVATWTDQTLKRLGNTYRGILYEAGLLANNKAPHKLIRPILDPGLEQWLRANKMEAVVKILLGGR